MALRDVAGAAFRYAKVLSLPFFGAGVLELPPAGLKRAKNSHRMHMAFFVHVGKVGVRVWAQQPAPREEEVNAFAITEGGVWTVPRGGFLLSFRCPLPDLLTLMLTTPRQPLRPDQRQPNSSRSRLLRAGLWAACWGRGGVSRRRSTCPVRATGTSCGHVTARDEGSRPRYSVLDNPCRLRTANRAALRCPGDGGVCACI